MFRRSVACGLTLGFVLTAVLARGAEPQKPAEAKPAAGKPAAAKPDASQPAPAKPEVDKAAAKAKSAAKPSAKQEDEYELVKILVDTLDQVDRNYVKDVDRRELVEAAIQGMLNKLDPYSSYITPQQTSQFRTSVENEFGGIGIQLDGEEGMLKVASPIYGTPAYRAGIVAGDRIVAIEGESTDKIDRDEAIRRLKGPPGTKVTITVLHPTTQESRKVTLTRELIHVETVLGYRRADDDTWDYMLEGDKRIGYVRVTAFSRDTARELRTVLRDLAAKKIRGLILDLRFNPGGLLNSAIEICSMFISEGRIVSTSGRNSPQRAWDAQKGETFEGFPMVILVNRYSASASEIVSACLQDHKRAMVVGERTWGKGSVQNVIELEGGNSLLKLTTASYKRPSGENIHRFPGAKDSDTWGVKPNQGYDLRLSDKDIYRLMMDRRQRDIVQPHESRSEALKVTQATASDKPAAAEKSAKKPPAEPAGKTADTKPDDKQPAAQPAKPEIQPAKPEAKSAKPEGKPAKSDSKPAAAKGAAQDESSKDEKFVDKQLEMAISYLAGELARLDHAP